MFKVFKSNQIIKTRMINVRQKVDQRVGQRLFVILCCTFSSLLSQKVSK